MAFSWGGFLSGIWSGITSLFTGAVATSAVKGAIMGSLTGAAISAIKGDDILKGALRGAAYGGAIGGVAGAVGTIGELSGIKDSTTGGMKTASGAALTPGEINVENMGGYSTPSEKSSFLGGLLNTEGKQYIAGQVVSGAADAYSTMKAAKTKSESDMAVVNRKAEIDREAIADNQPASQEAIAEQREKGGVAPAPTFKKTASGIPTFGMPTLDDWWYKRIYTGVA